MEEKFTFKSLRELRWDQGKLSQIDLARLSGVSRAHINKIEQGHLHLSGFTAPRIASVFKVNYKSMMLSQELANSGLSEPERKEVITIALKEAEDLSSATIGVIKKIRNLDFGDRDSFGRKLDPKEIKFRKEAKKKREDLDFGDRDPLGRKITRKEGEPDEDITMKELFEKDESTFESRLKALLLKGEQRRKG